MRAMHWTPIARIAWKDLRRIGALWVAFVSFWLIYLLFASVAAHYARDYLDPSFDQALVAIFATATVYGFSWAGITFAAEHDDKTYGHLRSLPVSANHVFYGKILFGVVSTLLLIAVLALLCGFHALALQSVGGAYQWSRMPVFPSIRFGFSFMFLLIPLGMAAGLFWSLRLKHPLQAVGLAAASTVILTYVCFAAPGWLARENGSLQTSFAFGLMACVVLGLTIVNRRRVTAWLPNFSSADQSRSPATVCATSTRTASDTSLGRLFWLHRQQNRWLARGLVTCSLLLACLHVSGVAGARMVAVILTPLGCVALGITVFCYEHQERRFRWLAQLGTRSFEYWISRLLLPAIAAVILAGVGVWMNLHAIEALPMRWSVGGVFASLLTIFTIAQFCSIAISSVIISLAVALIATSVAAVWIYFCQTLLITYWLSVLPVMLLPLVASYLRVSRWFRDTESWRQWIVPLLPLALLVVGLPIATACYRVYEVPGVELPSDLLAEPVPLTAEELAGAAQLNALLARLPPQRFADKTDRGHEQHAALARSLVKALDVASVLPEEFDGLNAGWETLRAAGDLLRAGGGQQTAAGNLAVAWNYYRAALELASLCQGPRSGTRSVACGRTIETSVYRELVPWAMHAANSAERIELSAADIDNRRQALAPWTVALRNDRRFYLETLSAVVAHPEQFDELPGAQLVRFIPWEVARAKRLEDYRLTHAYLNRKQALPAAAAAEPDPLQHDLVQFKIDRLASTTLFRTSLIPSVEDFVAAERDRRAMIYQLAAIAYHREHGFYPREMKQLTIAGQPLPEDIYSPGKLAILGLVGDDGLGPRLVSKRAGTLATFSDGQGHLAHFLLPEFDDWDPQRFASRVARTARNARAYPERNPTEAERAPAILASSTEPDAHDWFHLLPTETVSETLQDVVRRRLREGSVEERVALLKSVRQRPELTLHLLPEVVQQMDSPQVDLAALAAHLFLRAVDSDRAASSAVVKETISRLSSRLSVGPSASDFGAPIRNPDNGNFYELIPGQLSWDRAQRSAASRTFRGVRGHLATITSQSESEFVETLIAASTRASTSVWLGGNDHDDAGIWRWMCGPEAGTPFWVSATQTASEFTDWLAGEPGQSGFLYLEVLARGGAYAELEPGYGGWGGYGERQIPYGGMGRDSSMELELRTPAAGRHVPLEITSGWRSSRREGYDDDYALVEYEVVGDPNPDPETGED